MPSKYSAGKYHSKQERSQVQAIQLAEATQALLSEEVGNPDFDYIITAPPAAHRATLAQFTMADRYDTGWHYTITIKAEYLPDGNEDGNEKLQN